MELNQPTDSQKQAASTACATSGLAHFLTLQVLTSFFGLWGF